MEEKTKNIVRRCAWFFFAFCILVLVTVNAAYLLLARFVPKLLENTVALYILQYTCMYGIALPLAALILWRTPKVPIEKGRISLLSFGVYFLLAIGCMLIGSVLGRIVTFLPEVIFGSENPLSSLLNENTLLFSSVLTLFVAPIGEELVFRKLLIDRLARHGTVVAVSISALFFALFHQNFYQFFYALLLGLLLGYLYAANGRILYNILLHAAVNFTCGVLPNCLQMLEKASSPSIELVGKTVALYPFLAQLGMIFLTLFEYACALFVFFFALFFLHKHVHLKKGQEPVTVSNWDRLFLCDGVIVAVLFSVALLLLSLLPM